MKPSECQWEYESAALFLYFSVYTQPTFWASKQCEINLAINRNKHWLQEQTGNATSRFNVFTADKIDCA